METANNGKDWAYGTLRNETTKQWNSETAIGNLRNNETMKQWNDKTEIGNVRRKTLQYPSWS